MLELRLQHQPMRLTTALVWVPSPPAPLVLVPAVIAPLSFLSPLAPPSVFRSVSALLLGSGHLEGSGKGRRHLKLSSIDDIKGKPLAAYLTLAVQAAQAQSCHGDPLE
ncbi:MAG: hypothetical protein KME02_03220 [Aphanothece saxicola GSE-SYN-MK-01-06B]|jgi:hypothetical protein|nr:hypothetical protein [Aphanothece saxicola GSE-SYN-MK-01-06B]